MTVHTSTKARLTSVAIWIQDPRFGGNPDPSIKI